MAFGLLPLDSSSFGRYYRSKAFLLTTIFSKICQTQELIIVALAEKISSLMTEAYLGQRAKRGDRKKFEQTMARVADIEPEDHDKL